MHAYNYVYRLVGYFRGVYFTNFKIAAIRGINFRKIDRKPHHVSSVPTSRVQSSWKFSLREIREIYTS